MADFEDELAAFETEMANLPGGEDGDISETTTSSAVASSSSSSTASSGIPPPPPPPPGFPPTKLISAPAVLVAKPAVISAVVTGEPAAKKKSKKRKVAPTAELPPGLIRKQPTLAEPEEEPEEEKVDYSRLAKAADLYKTTDDQPKKPVVWEDPLLDAGVPSVSAAGAAALAKSDKKLFLRKAAGKIWNDTTLAEWPENDHRIFAGDLGNEVNDNTLAKVFVSYPSFAKAKVVRCKRTQKTKGYGFVSFLDPLDAAQALKEMQGAYVGNRPIKLRRSKWENREHQPKGRKNKKHLY